MYSCRYPSRFNSANAASNSADTQEEDDRKSGRRDWRASRANRGERPLLAISCTTLDENSLEIAANCSVASSPMFLTQSVSFMCCSTFPILAYFNPPTREITGAGSFCFNDIFRTFQDDTNASEKRDRFWVASLFKLALLRRNANKQIRRFAY